MQDLNCPTDNQSRLCPVCQQSDEVVDIIYGIPEVESIQLVEEGKIRLGGCTISKVNPVLYCKRDDHEFHYNIIKQNDC